MDAPSAPPDRGRLRALLDVARALGEAMEHAELIRTILAQMAEVMDAEASSVFLHDPETNELVMHAPHGPRAEQLLSLRLPDDKGIAGSVFQSRQFVNVRDAQKDPRFFRDADKKSGFVTHALMCAPLLDKGQCLGVIQALNPRHAPSFSDEDEGIFEGFALLATSAIVRLRAQEEALRRKRIEQELSIAREIQQAFLAARLPACACVRLAAYNEPARDISGDFYSVEELPDGRVLVALGDVSGKGIPAALTMARASAEIRALAPGLSDLGEWMGRLNDALCRDSVGGRFVAMTALLFEPGSSIVQACAAGQFPPLRLRDGQAGEVPLPRQLALGIAPGIGFVATHLDLVPGDLWLLFSDGVTEARDPSGDEFALARLRDSLTQAPTAHGAIDSVVASLRQFTGKAGSHDDATLIVAEWRGAAPPASWTIPAQPEALKTSRDIIERWAHFAGLPDADVGCLILGADEAAANIIRHAYRGAEGTIEYSAAIDDDGQSLAIRLRDHGTPVSEERLKGRDIEDVRPGGLGLHFMRCTFDEVRFEPHPDGTTLHLRKKLPRA